MKAGRTLAELAAELDRQKTTRKDYVAPQGIIEAQVLDAGPDTPGTIVLGGMNGTTYALTQHAHRQVADHLGIPQKYYDRMAIEQPQLLADNVNTWMHTEGTEQRMVRTLDGK